MILRLHFWASVHQSLSSEITDRVLQREADKADNYWLKSMKSRFIIEVYINNIYIERIYLNIILKIFTYIYKLLISCFNVHIIKDPASHRDGNKMNNSLFLFFSCVQRVWRFAAVWTWKRQVTSWFEVWPQCGESPFESGLLWIKTDLPPPRL